MIEQDTSAYWRKLLALDQAQPANVLNKHRTWHRYLRPILYKLISLPLRVYCPEKVVGLENLPARPPYIIAANHASSMDYAVVAWAMGKRREELYPITTKLFYDHPFTSFWIKVAANAVRIDTEDEFFPALRAAAQVLKAGKAVYINPEGTRSVDGSILPFRPGVGVLAVETGVPIVPVYIAGTSKALPTGWIFPRPYPVAVSFGKAIAMEPYIEKKRSVQAYDVYKEVTEQLRQRIVALSRSPY
ncbi:MAG: lysophospholipid acyltransferase family protein [Candidatus Margulisbacteria bacterium]|nr:lysophospholipid acyltransferase family protein [Candidatus Margulisiibacteriota bacterium]